jgi:hypothetical protein
VLLAERLAKLPQLASGTRAVHVLVLQPQIVRALGLPYPTDPAYPYK